MENDYSDKYVNKIREAKSMGHHFLEMTLDNFPEEIWVDSGEPPGTIFGYFAILNYWQGLQKIKEKYSNRSQLEQLKNTLNNGQFQKSPLHLACVHKSFRAAQELIMMGASANLRLEDKNGFRSTPLQLLLKDVKHSR